MDSKLIDYGYEIESKDNEEEDDRDAGEEDDTTIDELGALGYADFYVLQTIEIIAV